MKYEFVRWIERILAGTDLGLLRALCEKIKSAASMANSTDDRQLTHCQRKALAAQIHHQNHRLSHHGDTSGP